VLHIGIIAADDLFSGGPGFHAKIVFLSITETESRIKESGAFQRIAGDQHAESHAGRNFRVVCPGDLGDKSGEVVRAHSFRQAVAVVHDGHGENRCIVRERTDNADVWMAVEASMHPVEPTRSNLSV